MRRSRPNAVLLAPAIGRKAFGRKSLARLQEALTTWGKDCGRSFPWRRTRTPYRVLVAEKLLQQTAAGESVVRVYINLVRKYPSPTELAKAPVGEIRKLIRPLGLPQRAYEFRGMARVLVTRHEGGIPPSRGDLVALPGIGDYIADAILAFAFEKDVGVVDVNVARFLHRMFGIDGPLPKNPSRKKYLRDLAASLVPRGRSRSFNFAVLDLCAEICKARGPQCYRCPVRTFCVYGRGWTNRE